MTVLLVMLYLALGVPFYTVTVVMEPKLEDWPFAVIVVWPLVGILAIMLRLVRWLGEVSYFLARYAFADTKTVLDRIYI